MIRDRRATPQLGKRSTDLIKSERSEAVRFGRFKGFCCETGRYPNGPNIAGAPESVLNPGEIYRSMTVFGLSW